MKIEQLTPVQNEIVREIIEAIDTLGGQNDLTTALSSWGDTLPESEVLEQLREWNERNRALRIQPAHR